MPVDAGFMGVLPNALVVGRNNVGAGFMPAQPGAAGPSPADLRSAAPA